MTTNWKRPAGGRRSWRTAPADQSADPRFKRLARVCLSGIAVALVAVLLWLLIPPFFRSETHFVALPVVDYEVLDAPPLAFIREDVRGFATLADLLSRGPHPGPVVLAELQTSQAMQSLLAGQLQDVVPRSKDILLFYLAAQGMSDDGSAYLLCSDFDSTRAEGGRQRLVDVLRQISTCHAAVKLVLLDGARRGTDPRLGMMANEFPRLVETELRSIPDANLWVLMAHDLAETSLVSYRLKRSRFAYVVNEGLNGRAEADGDGEISLSELYDFVRRETARWADRSSAGEQSQTPVLLRGGEGRVTNPPPGIALVQARTSEFTNIAKVASSSTESTTAPAANAASDSSGLAFAQPATPVGTTGSLVGQSHPSAASTASSPSTVATASAAAPAGAPPPGLAKAGQPVVPGASNTTARSAHALEPEVDMATADVASLLSAAWKLRDQIDDRAAHEGWSPVDYAPHLWREFQELILGYELRYRAGAAFAEHDIADDLRKNVLPLASLFQVSPLAPVAARATIADRLATARQRFYTGPLRTTYESEPADIREARTLTSDAVFRAVGYVRWLGQSAVSTGGNEQLVAELQRLMATLANLSLGLDQLRPAAPVDTSDVQTLREGVRTDVRRLRDQRAAFDARLEHDAQILVEDPSGAGNTRRIEELLATTLLSAQWRRRLIECLPRSESQPPTFDAGEPRLWAATSALDQPRWERLGRQVELELSLVRWADYETAQLVQASEKLARAISMRPLEQQPAADDHAWRALGEFGHALAAYYRDLPQQINQRAHAARDIASQRRIERLLRLVDARDAERIDERVSIAPLPQESVEASLALDAPARLHIRRDDWTRLDVHMQSDRGLPTEVWAALDFDPARLEVRTLEPEQAVLPRVRPSVPPRMLDDQGAGQFTFLLRSKVENGSPTPLEVRVHAADREFTRTVTIELPGPDRIDWLVQGDLGTVGGAADDQRWTADDEGALQLLPFPNRTTNYRFALRNRSGREQKVQVTLLTPPAANRFGQRPELPPMASDWQPSGFETLVTIKDLVLPADGSTVALVYPVAPPPAAATAAAGAAAGTKLPPKVRPAIHRRLIGVVQDASGNDKRWVKWLEFSVQPPRNYLDAEAAYDRAAGRIKVRLRPLDFDQDGQPDLQRMPPGGSFVKWNIGAEIDPAAAMQAEDEATAPNFEAQLFADVPPDNQKNVDIRLTVDGYPRAFVWLVNCGNTQQRLHPRRDLRQVKIVAPRQNEAFRAPLAVLPVQLEVDAPADAFRDPTVGDVLEVGLDATLDRSLNGSRVRRLHADRQVELFVDDLKADGTIGIDAQVHDYRLDLEPWGLMNTIVEVGAQLTVGRQDPINDFVRVALDGAPPRLDVTTIPTGATVTQGNDIQVVVRCRDLSGIKKVEVGFDVARSGTMDKPLLAPLDAASASWRVGLPTKDLPPGNFVLLVRATDNVGLLSDLARVSVTVLAPPSVATMPRNRPQNSIIGTVTLDGEGQAGVKVSLSGGSAASAVSDQDGAFAFRDLAPGRYKLSAKGAVKNSYREAGPIDVDLEAAPRPPASVNLDLQ